MKYEKYKAVINVTGDADLIQKVFTAEDTQIKDKASYRIKKSKNNIVFTVGAEDSTGLRTALNSITKVLTVIEKVKKI